MSTIRFLNDSYVPRSRADHRWMRLVGTLWLSGARSPYVRVWDRWSPLGGRSAFVVFVLPGGGTGRFLKSGLLVQAPLTAGVGRMVRRAADDLRGWLAEAPPALIHPEDTSAVVAHLAEGHYGEVIVSGHGRLFEGVTRSVVLLAVVLAAWWAVVAARKADALGAKLDGIDARLGRVEAIPAAPVRPPQDDPEGAVKGLAAEVEAQRDRLKGLVGRLDALESEAKKSAPRPPDARPVPAPGATEGGADLKAVRDELAALKARLDGHLKRYGIEGANPAEK